MVLIPRQKVFTVMVYPEFKAVLDELGLTTTSGHYGFSDYFNATQEELRWFVDQCIKAAKTLESPYITWPWIHPDYRNAKDFRRLATLLDHIGKQITEISWFRVLPTTTTAMNLKTGTEQPVLTSS